MKLDPQWLKALGYTMQRNLKKKVNYFKNYSTTFYKNTWEKCLRDFNAQIEKQRWDIWQSHRAT